MNGNLNFLQTDVTNALAQFGGAEGLDGSIIQSNISCHIVNVFVSTWLRSRQGVGIVTASKHAETEDNSLADIGAIRIGDVTVT